MLTTPASMAVSVWRLPSGTTNPTPTGSACVSGTTGAVIANAVSYLHLLGSRSEVSGWPRLKFSKRTRGYDQESGLETKSHRSQFRVKPKTRIGKTDIGL
jgi:hypothetical protein